jgi:hypothetical protein
VSEFQAPIAALFVQRPVNADLPFAINTNGKKVRKSRTRSKSVGQLNRAVGSEKVALACVRIHVQALEGEIDRCMPFLQERSFDARL